MKKQNHYVILDESDMVMGVAKANTVETLESKIESMLDGIREPIKEININEIEKVNDYDVHEFSVEFEDEEEETFQIQRIDIY